MKNFALSFFLLSAFWAVPTLTRAQQSCPSDEITDQLIATDPVFARSYMYLEQAIAAHAALDASARSNEVYVIPVVVHVIHEGEPVGTGSNISEAQILSAIAALNEDFRKLPGSNGDGDGVDVRIEFCLASRSPNNQASTGIVRVNGSSVPLYAEQGIEATGGIGANEEAVKALSTWPRTQYMNIWVVNEIENNDAQGGIQGFAYFPVNSPIDGITVLHNAFGTVGNIKSSTPLNRTLTHEVGHYFGLYHTFHATNSCSESNCISGGDKVCDTPPTPLNSDCNDPECAATQLVENYLDYTAESCKNMFTEGQKTRMRATLESDRASLLSSLGCEAVSAVDCGISHIVNPTGNLCSASVTPSVTLTNYGSNALTSCKVHYNLDGVGNNFINWNGNLASGLSVNITLPVVSASAGLHNFFAWTSLPNAMADQGTGNDQSSSEFFVSTGSNASLLVQLDIFGTENTWEILDENNAVVSEGGPFVNNQQGTEINTNLCIPGGCYTLVFHDSYGDGQGFTYGDFTLFDAAGNVLVFESDDWGEEVSNPFCVEDIVPDGTAPEAAFTASTTNTCVNAPVSFTDASSQSPTSWSWTFEGGTPATSNDQHPQNISYAAAGTYDVTLTVSNPFGADTYTWPNYVVVNAVPVVTLGGTNPSCFGSANGQVQNTVTGAGPFSYAWNNGQTSQHLSGVGAGVYIVTVTDANGCQKQKTKTLTQPSAVTVNANIVSPSCYGMSDGSLYAQAIGGTQGYSYAWSNGSSAQQVSNVSAGAYALTVTDLNGCTVSQSYSVSQPPALAMNLMSFDMACTDAAGSAMVNPAGGTGAYTVEWSSGASGLQATGLTAGNYQVEVSDANGCSVLQDFAITASENLSVVVSVEEISCHGMADGAASAFVSGGTGIYTYDWSQGANAASLSNLDAGTYNLQVSDSEGCEGAYSFTLEEPDALSLAVIKNDISCFGLADGSLYAEASGGSPGYSYAWNNGSSAQQVSNASAGVYTLTVTDLNGCTVSQSYSISQPSALVMNLMPFDIACTNETGSATVNPSGGTGPYAAEWSSGASGLQTSGLAAGNYQVEVSDANGCSVLQDFAIAASENLSVFVTVEEISCYGMADGEAHAFVGGGTGIYTYDWSHGANDASLSNLDAGTYNLQVSDSEGCAGFYSFTLEEPDALSLAVFKSDISCYGLTDGSASATCNGGTGPYIFNWSNGTTGVSTTGLEEGLHLVMVQDTHGCSVYETFMVMEPSQLVGSAQLISPETCAGNNGSVVVNIMGGTPGYVAMWSTGTGAYTLEGLSAGFYTANIMDGNGCMATVNISVPYDCSVVVPVTHLTDEFCNSTGHMLSDVIYCEAVPFADMYQWSLMADTGELLAEQYSMGNAFYLFAVNGLSYGMTLSVQVRARKSGVWGEYGLPCSIAMSTQSSLTSLDMLDCGALSVSVGDTLSAIPLASADAYEFHITGDAYDFTITQVEYYIVLTDFLWLSPGATYNIRVRTLSNESWSEWGESCKFTMAAPTGILEFGANENPITFYPNPGSGTEIFIDLSNLSPSDRVKDLEIYGTAGNLIETISLSQLSPGMRAEYKFRHPLSTGMYVLRYTLNGYIQEEKLVVR